MLVWALQKASPCDASFHVFSFPCPDLETLETFIVLNLGHFIQPPLQAARSTHITAMSMGMGAPGRRPARGGKIKGPKRVS